MSFKQQIRPTILSRNESHQCNCAQLKKHMGGVGFVSGAAHMWAENCSPSILCFVQFRGQTSLDPILPEKGSKVGLWIPCANFSLLLYARLSLST